MCGRFALTLPHEAMSQLFDASIGAALMPVPRYNICPTHNITTATSGPDGRHLLPMRWGFLPSWYKSDRDGPLLINARAETIAEKPAFRAACRTRRCLIPATGFYEWTKAEDGSRQPWYIYPRDVDFLAFAGIWQDWTSPEGEVSTTCAMVTTAANDTISAIHHRMPVTIAPSDFALWLGEEGKGAATLMRAGPEGALQFHRVDTRVNSNRPDDPELLAPLNG
ncbi:MAG: SOS response-associated peptidase [Rhodobacter sp.]|jgi:putative SOS response-associated peptidase YedK|nr:SOS response-associated peptidase [Rhodobacter sp.]